MITIGWLQINRSGTQANSVNLNRLDLEFFVSSINIDTIFTIARPKLTARSALTIVSIHENIAIVRSAFRRPKVVSLPVYL